LYVVYSCTKFDTHPLWCCAQRRQRLVIQFSRLEQERDLPIPQAVTVLFRCSLCKVHPPAAAAHTLPLSHDHSLSTVLTVLCEQPS
jgi:hypothetical protein